MTNFSDIFKSDFLQNVTSVSLADMAIALALAFLVGLFIFFIYKKTYSGVMYSSGFGVSLIAMCMITTLAILAVTSNVILSLGMVGALSIVRFRTAVKDPLDIVFLFWAISAGIVLASGMIPLAIIGSAIIGVVLVIFVNKKPHKKPFIVVVQCDGQQSEANAREFLQKNTSRITVKSKSVTKGMVEINYDVRLKGENTDFMNTLCDMQGVKSAVLVSYNGDYAG